MKLPSNLSVGVALIGLSLAATYALCHSQREVYPPPPQRHPDLTLQIPTGRTVMDAKVKGQVVFTFDHRQEIEGSTVDVMVVKPEQSVVFGLIPLDRQAPLPPASWVLCTMYVEKIAVRFEDGLERNEVNEIGFNCGGKRYLFAKLDIQ